MENDFTELFNEWAHTYDDTVGGRDAEYRDVFHLYEDILDEVVLHSKGLVLEFGVGTGNLSERFLNKGIPLVGIEPSEKMREKALHKNPTLLLYEGNFLQFPSFEQQIDTIVSTYAFHHLTDQEKQKAFQLYHKTLSSEGQIVFADTMFETEESKQHMIQHAKARGFHRLACDLQSEFYTTLPALSQMAQSTGFSITYKPLNAFVWLMIAKKNDSTK
ncbi:class I SAM-dependent DNA methyltransferase [Alkalihalobacillus sp. NPDC078783]